MSQNAQVTLAAFMDAVVIVDPVHYQRRADEPADTPHAPMRTLHFGQHHQGLVTFLVHSPDELALVVKIQWLGE
ncbi:MAG: hypothetical protein ACRDNF_16965 [Streptosporangiaceae bacterium]